MSLKQTLDKITSQRTAAGQSSRRRRQILYGLGAVVLVLVILYFVRQFNSLVQNRQVGLSPPIRQERLDTTKGKPAALTRLYEQEEKNRYQDSLSLAREEKALDYIVMDWENLYDLRKRKAKAEPAKAQATDSLAILLRLLKAKDSTRLAHTAGKTVRKAVVKPKGIGTRNNQKQEKQDAYASAPVDPFNTVRAVGQGNPSLAAYPLPGEDKNGSVFSHMDNTATSETLSDGLIPAVVHGAHKVKPGGKVTFRTQQEAWVEGILLPRNTLITGMADLGKGRITFSGFRAKVAGRSLVLPFNCYDLDLMAGISYGDQALTEAEVRRGAATSLSGAAGELSNAIPYGALARAASTIARGAIRGSARSKQMFIYLSDGYKVFLEPQPDKK